MDALSDVLRVVGLTGGVFLDAVFTHPWAISGKVHPEYCRPFMAEPAHVICYHYVVEGGFELRLEPHGDWVPVRAGEAVLLPRNDLHSMGTDRRAAPVSPAAVMQASDASPARRIVHGGGGARTRLVCGFLGGARELQPLLTSLPAIMAIDLAESPNGDWMGRTFSYAAQTLAAGDPGAATVLAKTSELLFVEAVRRHLAQLPDEATGWFAGLRDAVVGRALALMHAKPAFDWTADDLAGEVNLSRSAFTQRFTALIGQPPIRYLTQWRMQVATHKLRERRSTIAQIAFDVGYDSEAAFSRAFRREFGVPPAAWRKQAASE
jgi:AraC-like DNA-binding protein